MKISISAIWTALTVLVALSLFTGFAAAESPDAGSTWNTAKSFTAYDGSDTLIYGTLSEDPSDADDWWKAYNTVRYDELYIALDSTSYSKSVKLELRDGGQALMQKILKPNKDTYTAILDPAPAYISVHHIPEDIAYQFVLSRNV